MIKLPDDSAFELAFRDWHPNKTGPYVKQQMQFMWYAAIAEVQRLNATAQPVSDGWVKCSERMPNPEDARRVCVFTPSEHPDLKIRLVSSDLFKTVCRSATHWIYVDEPAAPGGQDEQ